MMKKYILVCFCCGFLISPALAQQQDSIAKAREEADALDAAMRRRSEDDSAYQVKFNALRYSMQKRYRPKGATFVKDRFFDNFFVGVWGGYNRIIPRTGVELTGATELGLSLSKFFTPNTGVRLSGGWSSATRKSDNESWNSYSITADHIYNLSSAVAGYNPNRLFEVSTVGGLGFHMSSVGGKSKSAGDFHVGMQLKLNTGTRLDLFAEPRLTFYTDGIDVSNEKNWHKYDAGLSAIVGLSYRLGTYYKYGSNVPFEDSFMENTFISAGMGMQFHNSPMVRQQGILGSMGPIFHVAVGKWFLDPFGIRLSAFGSNNSWKKNEQGDMNYMTAYGGGRAEAMINPLAFFKQDTRDMRWGIIPMFGVEMGMMMKQDVNGLIKKAYAGWTGGLQVKYYVSDNFAFYIEPRMSRVPYTFSQQTTSGKLNQFSYYDNLFNANIGIELRRPTRPDWKRLAPFRDGFVPYNYVQLGAGMATPQQIYRSVSRRPGYMLNAALGRQFNPLSGARLSIDVNNANSYDTEGTINRYSFANVSLDYLFNISNFVIGYDPERKFGAEVLAGLVIGRDLDSKRNLVGGEGGVRAYWNLLDQFDIYAEPKARMYLNRYVPATRGKGTPLQFSFVLGSSYRFGSSFNRSLVTNFGDGTFLGNAFISASVGSRCFVKSNLGINPVIAAGPVFSVAVGKWLLPFWGLRMSAFGGYNTWGRVQVEQKLTADRLTSRFGGRIEAMFNVLAIGKEDVREQRWGLSPILGLEFGMLDKQNANIKIASMKKSYAGITAALQAKYYVTDNIGVFVEPRLSRLPYAYQTTGKGKANRVSSVDNVMSFNLGLEFRRSSKSDLKRLSSFKDEFEPYFFASYQMGAAMPMHKMRYTSRKLGYSVEGSIGRQFSPISAVRANLDYSSLPGNGKIANKNAFVNLSLDYMFDIGNYLGGYDPERKFGVDVLAGLVLSMGAEPNKTVPGGEGGFHVYYKLPQGFDVFVEPKLRMHSKKMLYGSSATPLQMMLSVGTSYKF